MCSYVLSGEELNWGPGQTGTPLSMPLKLCLENALMTVCTESLGVIIGLINSKMETVRGFCSYTWWAPSLRQ